ncbi:MAG: aspartyl protease family protein, partial [Cyanobacteria bacterium]|nr:aspartyl protease family protein [Cyanobacteriota bacterium]
MDKGRRSLSVAALMAIAVAASAYSAPQKNEAYHQAIDMAKAGQQFAYNRNWKKACSVYEQTLQIYPNYPAVRVALAQAYVEWATTMSAQDAYVYFKRAAELDPANKAAIAGMGRTKSSSQARIGVLKKELEAQGEVNPQIVELPSTVPQARAFVSASTPDRNARAAMERPSDLNDLPDQDRIPIRRDGTRLMVDAKVNGKNIEMQFDTGADFCFIGCNHLKQMGIDPTKLKGRSELVGGSGGGAVTTLVVPMNLKIGNTSRTVEMFVHPNYPGHPLVGQNFLTGLQYEINNQLSVLLLRKMKEAPAGEIAKKVDPRDRNVVQYRTEGKSIVVPVEVCGKKIDMIFDTGADGIAFGAAAWNELHLTSAKLLGYGTSRGIDGVRPVLGYNVE